MSTREKVNDYSTWFAERTKFISKINDDETKILCCCTLMDALAKCVEPARKNNERFTNLLELFGQNDIWIRVSIYHLVNDPKFIGIKRNKDLPKIIKGKNKNYLLAGLKEILPSDVPVYSGPGLVRRSIHLSKLPVISGLISFNAVKYCINLSSKTGG